MTPSEVIQLVSVCGTIALGCLALIATIVKMGLDYRERRAHFRQATYSKQVEACFELNLSARNLFFHLHHNIGKPMDPDELKAFASQTKLLCKSFQDSNNKWYVFLPLPVVCRVTDFLGATNEVLDASMTKDASSKVDALVRIFHHLVSTIRFSLGVDVLSVHPGFLWVNLSA